MYITGVTNLASKVEVIKPPMITQASGEQSTGINQVTVAVGQMDADVDGFPSEHPHSRGAVMGCEAWRASPPTVGSHGAVGCTPSSFSYC